MAKVQVPNSIQKFGDLDQDLSTTVATALWRKMAQLQEYMNRSVPIGIIIMVRTNQELLPELPDPKYWKEMDGTVVNNTDSPLHGWVTHDLRGLFLKHPAEGQSANVLAGSDTINISHNHGGLTGNAYDIGPFEGDNDDERQGPYVHRHAINSWTGVFNIVPSYNALKFYIRIA